MISGLVMQFREKDNNVLNFVFFKNVFLSLWGFFLLYFRHIEKTKRFASFLTPDWNSKKTCGGQNDDYNRGVRQRAGF